MKFVYIIHSFDVSAWIENHNIIAFNSEEEARKYCKIHSKENDVLYTWVRIPIGRMKRPYPKAPKPIHLLP